MLLLPRYTTGIRGVLYLGAFGLRYPQCMCAYGTSEPWVYGTLRSSESIVPLDLRVLSVPGYGTLGAVSAPLVMPLHDLEIPISVPITFRDQQLITP